MPIISGQYVPHQVLQGGAVGGPTSIHPPAGAASPTAPSVNAGVTAGPGTGGAATADAAQQQLPAAQQAAGMQPPGADASSTPPAEASMSPGAPGAIPPGFVPNSQNQQVYAPGSGPITISE